MNSVICEGVELYPSKIVCVGRNYSEHILELGNQIPDNMVLFIKPNSSVSSRLISSHDGENAHYEAEISFLFRSGRLAAVGVGLDLTKRELQSELMDKGLPWEKCKAFDESAVFSEFVDLQWDGQPLKVTLKVDGQLIQEGATDQMIYNPAEILEEVSRHFSLNDGDIIMTGTPKGVGAVKRGSTYEGSIFFGEKLIASVSWVAL